MPIEREVPYSHENPHGLSIQFMGGRLVAHRTTSTFHDESDLAEQFVLTKDSPPSDQLAFVEWAMSWLQTKIKKPKKQRKAKAK